MSNFSQEPSLFHQKVCPNLCRGERLFIGSLRRWMRGSEDWDRAVREAVTVLKPAAGLVFANALGSLAQVIDDHARRTLRMRIPSSKLVSTDERSLIALIGALQHDRFDHAHAILQYLVVPAARRAAISHALSVSRALQKGGFNFLMPRGARPARAEPRLRSVA